VLVFFSATCVQNVPFLTTVLSRAHNVNDVFGLCSAKHVAGILA